MSTETPKPLATFDIEWGIVRGADNVSIYGFQGWVNRFTFCSIRKDKASQGYSATLSFFDNGGREVREDAGLLFADLEQASEGIRYHMKRVDDFYAQGGDE